MFHALVVLTRT